MKDRGLITMSLREVDRFKVIQATAEGLLAQVRAAERLGITTRQVRRLIQRWRMDGPVGLLSRQRGQPGHRQLPRAVEARVRELIRDAYADFGPTLACEKLRERHGIHLAKETVRRIMIDAGFWVPRKQRPPKVHQPRRRRACLGELVQIDGSDHAWFEDRGPPCTLLVFVDDATSRLMQLLFVPTESAFSYFAATRAYLERHGKPVAFYSDKAGIFRVNQPNATGGDGHTQFGRALYELNIESLCANTSQAKGRVERMNGTLQDRLVKELRLRGISSMEAANAFAPVFQADFNVRFARIPRSDFNAHRPLRPDEDLDRIFTWREWRKVSASLTLQYDKTLYLLEDQPAHRRLIHRYIEVAEYPDGRIELWADGAALPYTTYDRLSEIDQGAVVENKRLGHVLAIAQQMQAKRDDRRSGSTPSRTLSGQPLRPRRSAPDTKRQRALDEQDLRHAIDELAPPHPGPDTAGQASTTALQKGPKPKPTKGKHTHH
ncbi:Integrase core domain-containing protein [Cupriavidus sp. YR651]|uniref:ISNCY family transposase n=1 Tax=Cupriavidus sp. YR651 TaxID=1855315 RepID=UPI00087E786F|nr:ISNCY family transposase [Cupriavidus sp. YR651]SDD53494.1 Integrase core domain-containing protein [Cupriavidus sp. YR651]